jgi:glycosidase
MNRSHSLPELQEPNLSNESWWQQGIVYRIDAGLEDIAGIISRLDYLTWLGVTVVWISPLQGSTFDRLVAEAHNRSLRVIFDERLVDPIHVLTPWNTAAIAALIKQNEATLTPGNWPTWALRDHDHSRLAAMLLLTLRGTPILHVPSAPDSPLLSLYRDLIFIRQLEPALAVGAYREMQLDGDLLVYERLLGHQRFVIALNFGSHELPFHLRTSGAIVASTSPGRPIGEHNVEDSAALTTTLQPFEAIVIRVA